MKTIKRLQGKIIGIVKTGDTFKDAEGRRWERCILKIKLTGFSLRTPDEKLPTELQGKSLIITRFLCHDWHFKIGALETLSPGETESILKGEALDTVWMEGKSFER